MDADGHADGTAETRAGFLLRLRARGVRDLAVLKALETIPRDRFVSHRHVDLAARDLALPLPCGQVLPEPFFVGRVAEALTPSADARVLEIGAGSGYATAILARLFREVLAVERFRTLADRVRERLNDLGVVNATVAWGDGLDVPEGTGLFDRIVAHAELPELPPRLVARLAPEGVALFARLVDTGAGPKQHVVRVTRDGAGAWSERVICPSRLGALVPGVSRAL